MSHLSGTCDHPENSAAGEAAGVFRSAKRVAGLTLASRVLGLVRDSVCAAVFGSGPEWGAFVFAFRIPNLFRRLFGEGALAATFIPTFSDVYERQGAESAWRLFRRTFAALLALLGGLTCLLYILCAVAGVFLGGTRRWFLVFPLVNTILPYLAIICIVAFFGAALQARKHFTIPAVGPIINNVFWIGGALLALRAGGALSQRIFLIPVAILAGGAVTLAVHVPALVRRGATLRPELAPHDEALSKIARNMAPIILGLSIVQFNVLVDGLIARILISNEADGHLYFANRLFQFPLAMLGISLGTALFPTLTQLVARARTGEARRIATRALGVAFFLAFPAAIGLAVMDRPVVSLLFEHGRFSAFKTDIVSPILACYALGLPAHCAIQVLVRMFYARGDTRTPVRVAVLAMVVNLGLNLAFVYFLRETGLALATAISAWIQLAVLFAAASGRLKMIDRRSLLVRALRHATLAAAMGAAVILLRGVCQAHFDTSGLAGRAGAALLPVAAGAILYVGAAALLRFDELGALFRRK